MRLARYLISSLLLSQAAFPAEPSNDGDFARIVENVIRRAYVPGGRDGVFRVPQDEQLEIMRALVRDCQTGAATGSIDVDHEDLGRRATSIGFELLRVGSQRQAAWVLRERVPGQGAGVYLFALSPRNPGVVVQAPHARADVDTERIAVRLFVAGGFAGLHAGTLSRFAGTSPTDSAKGPADLCHNPQNFLQAATQGAADALQHGLILQVHGFARQPEGPLENVDAVISDGTNAPGAVAVHARQELQAAWQAHRVQLNGHDIRALGGTTNRQGAWLRLNADDAFLHLETGPDIRARLMREPALVTATANVLAAVAAQYRLACGSSRDPR